MPELYLQLGAALAIEGRFEEATDAFQRALDEGGGIGEEDMLEDLVHAADDAGARDLALRARLELSLLSPARASLLVSRAAKLVDDDVVAAEGRWVLDEWHPRFQQRDVDAAASFEGAVLAGRIALFVGDEKKALALFARAAAVAPERGRAAAQIVLETDPLPARLHAADEQSHWLRARAYDAFGVPERALEEVDAALGASEEAGGDDAMLEFKIRLLQAARRTADAAGALVELGRRFDVRTDHARAVDAYARATELNPGDAEPWWYLADSRRLAAALAASGPTDLDELGRARDAMDAGLATRAPSPAESWVYWSAALLTEEFANRNEHPHDLLFEAALYAEQAVALEPLHTGPWLRLSFYYRSLSAPAAAIGAVAQATQIDGTDDQVVMAWALTLGELGIDGVLEAIDLYEQDRRGTSWSAATRGFVLLYQHHYDEAESALRAGVRDMPDNPWALYHLALGRALAGDDDGAREYASAVLTAAPETPVDVEVLAGSALLVGDLSTARGLFEGRLDGSWLDPVEARLGLACVQQLGGDSARASALWAEAADLVTHPRHASAGRVSLDLLERLGAQVDRDAWLAPFVQAAERVAKRDFGDDEALHELAAVARESTVGDTRWLTAMAGYARVLASQRRWAEAAAAYESLLPYSGPAPSSVFTPARSCMIAAVEQEAQDAVAAGDAERFARSHRRLVELGQGSERALALGIASAHRVAGQLERALKALEPLTASASGVDETVAAAWAQTGDILLELRRPADAGRAYERSLQASSDAAVENRAMLQTRMGVAAAAADDPMGALGFMRAALDALRPQEGRTRAAQTVMRGAYGGASADDIPLLPMTLRALIEDREERRGQRRRLASARFESLRAGETRSDTPVPLALEADAAMFPDGAATQGVAELIDDAIPGMRDRVRHDTGVLVPGVRVRASELLSGGAFTVHLHGVPYAGGRVPAGAKLCTAAQACHDLGLEGEPLANAWLGRRAAVWLDSELVRAAEQAGLPLLDGYSAMLWNLEGLVRVHLHRLVGLAEVDYMVEEWRTEHPAKRSEIVAAALPGQRARIGFTAMLRTLTGERISVSDVGSLLEVYAVSGSVREAVEQAVEVARSVAPEVRAPALGSGVA